MTKLLTFLTIAILVIACKNPSKDQSTLKILTFAVDSVSGEPSLFTDSVGVTYLSWVEKTKEKSTLSFSKLNEGKWSNPTVISSGENWFVNWADYPTLAADGSGSMIAHFLEKSE
jgi:hypothetical protein